MLTFYGIGKVKKDKISLVEKASDLFMKEVAKEEGVLDFKFYWHKEEPTWFLAHEVYKDEEAFEKHRKTQHVDDFIEVLMASADEDVIRGFWEEFASINR